MFKKIEKFLSMQVNKDMLFLSELLNYQGENKVLYAEFFNQVSLDYSLESLTCIDLYLSKIHEYFQENKELIRDKQLQNPEIVQKLVSITLRVGAYVGETIREHDQLNQWYWIKSKRTEILNPILLNAKNTNKNHSSPILTNGDKYLFPMNVVIELIAPQRQNSTSISDCVREVLKLNSHQD